MSLFKKAKATALTVLGSGLLVVAGLVACSDQSSVSGLRPTTPAFGFGIFAGISCQDFTAVRGNLLSPVTFVASGGAGAPYTFTAQGLPDGLVVSSAGVLSGIPLASGDFFYNVSVTDAAGVTGNTGCVMVVTEPPTAACATISATQGTPMAPVALVATGGVGPYTFSATDLPAGLAISSNGTISGTSTVSGTFAYTVTITDSMGAVGTLHCSLSVTPVSSTGYTTYTQGGWGANPHGNNPGQLLTSKFAQVYPGGSVAIGGTKKLTFTSAAAIIKFLPAGGTPGILAGNATNPTSSAAGVFAGQVLALRLSVNFSAAGITKSGLGSLHVLSGKTAGLTVSQVLALGELVLGGGALPSGISVSDINSVIDSINNNYDGGTVNHQYLGA